MKKFKKYLKNSWFNGFIAMIILIGIVIAVYGVETIVNIIIG